MFITIEGVDGIGKSTLVDELMKEYPFAIRTKEPQDKEFIATNSVNPAATLYSYMLDHSKHCDFLKKNLYGNMIICDRYIDSRCAYQSVELRIPWYTIRAMHISEHTFVPDLTFILIAPIDLIIERLQARDGEMWYTSNKKLQEKAREVTKNRYTSYLLEVTKNRYISYLLAVQNNFMRIAEENPYRCKVIDVSGKSTDDIRVIVDKHIKKEMGAELKRLSKAKL